MARVAEDEVADIDVDVDRLAGEVAPAHLPTTAASAPDQTCDQIEMIDGRPRDVYDRFTKSQKRRMTAIVSFSALLSRESPPPTGFLLGRAGARERRG